MKLLADHDRIVGLGVEGIKIAVSVEDGMIGRLMRVHMEWIEERRKVNAHTRGFPYVFAIDGHDVVVWPEPSVDLDVYVSPE